MNPKILFLDIENTPCLGYIWGIWQQNVSLNQLLDVSETLCFAAKWQNSKDVSFSSLQTHTKEDMLKHIHSLLDEADIVVTYNGKRHDIPHLNRGFVEVGLTPPSPYKQVDLLETTKRQFKFPSNKLEYVVEAFSVGKKMKNSGFELWLGCMRNDEDSWKEMKKYNIQDIKILESLYAKVLPWIKNHPNLSMHHSSALVCPHCASEKVQKRGVSITKTSRYQRYQCNGCGTWFKDNIILNRNEFKTSEAV